MNTETPIEKKSDILDPKANAKALSRILVLIFVPVVILGGAGWLAMDLLWGPKAANHFVASTLRLPEELRNTTEQLPASSFKALPLELRRRGTVSLKVEVLRGNPIDVHVVTADQIDKIKRNQRFQSFVQFDMVKAKSYQRSGLMAEGTYYLVLYDKTLGVLSQGSSEVHVEAKLE